LWISHLFLLSYLSIALVSLVGFEWEGLEHLYSCHCIGLNSPRRFGGESLLSLLLLGSWNPRRLSVLVDYLGAFN
jgi:hypothetical protein